MGRPKPSRADRSPGRWPGLGEPTPRWGTQAVATPLDAGRATGNVPGRLRPFPAQPVLGPCLSTGRLRPMSHDPPLPPAAEGGGLRAVRVSPAGPPTRARARANHRLRRKMAMTGNRIKTCLSGRRPSRSPSPGRRPGLSLRRNIRRPNGPSGPPRRNERLARWAGQNHLGPTVTQADGLDWANRRPLGAPRGAAAPPDASRATGNVHGRLRPFPAQPVLGPCFSTGRLRPPNRDPPRPPAALGGGRLAVSTRRRPPRRPVLKCSATLRVVIVFVKAEASC